MQSVAGALAIWVATLRFRAFLAQRSLGGTRLVVPHRLRKVFFGLLQSAQVARMLRYTAFVAQGAPGGFSFIAPHGYCISVLRLLQTAQVARMHLRLAAGVAKRPSGRIFLV